MPRPKSVRAHSDVLQAAIVLMAERGIDATSMDAVAQHAGVSKATIYNHWRDKEALLLDAMADLHGHHQQPDFNTGDTRADMAAVLSFQPPRARAELQRRITPHLIAYSAQHPKFGEAWRHQAMEPPRRELTRLIEQGVRRGELAGPLDTGLCLALLLGPVLYRRIFSRHEAALADKLPERVVDAFWRAFRKQPAATATGKSPRRAKQ